MTLRPLARSPIAAPIATLIVALMLAPAAQAAKFTYHGDLMDGDAPANGAYDLRVRAFAQPGDAKALAEAIELPGVTLTDGRFNVALDLPEDADGITWVEVAVRKSGSGADYETLGDPQPLAKANSTCPGAWALDGNSGAAAGSFLGFVDNTQPLVLKANNSTVATFTPNETVLNYGDAPRVVLGSSANVASGFGATVSGGGATKDFLGNACPACKNTASGNFTTVGGGRSNTASNLTSTVSGGYGNTASQESSTVGGGSFNTASGDYSTVDGGRENCAGGANSWAGGWQAKIRPGTNSGAAGTGCNGVALSGDAEGDKGTFVWADSQGISFTSTDPDQFLVRAGGGVMFNTNALVTEFDDMVIGARAGGDADADLVLKTRSDRYGSIFITDSEGAMRFGVAANATDTQFVFGGGSNAAGRFLVTGTGAYLTTGGTWTNNSSRTFKHAFEAIDASDVLARVVALPLTRWQYRQSQEGKHLGPMAEDFAAAFGLGGDTEHISTVDADGVALAAIQGLNAKLEAENATLRASLDLLAARLAKLEASQGE